MNGACIVYCSVTHLFVSGGLYYAADLARRYRVHVVLHREQAQAITDSERHALEDRGVTFHWLDTGSRIARHKQFAAAAVGFLDDIQPRFILSLDDMGLFSCYLGRHAERRNIPFVCFQSGAFLAADGEEQRHLELNYGYATHVQSLRDKGWPSAAAKIIVRLLPRLRHVFDYWVGPTLVEGAPFRGTSSLHLRTGIECQRYGLAFFVNQPGARDFRIADGMPADNIVSVPHPLSSRAGQAIYRDIYGPEEKSDILVLVAYSMRPGPDHVEAAAAGLSRLVPFLAARYGDRRVLVKLHPTMASDEKGAVVECLRSFAESYSNVVVVPPLVNAVGLIGKAAVVISTPSTVLGLARLFDRKIVACTSFDTPLADHPLPVPTGVHLFPTAAHLEGIDLLALTAVPPGAEIPPDAASQPIDQLILTNFSRGSRPRISEKGDEKLVMGKSV